MVVSVPLSRFLKCLELAKEFDRTYPTTDQTGWLLRHWSFEDGEAHYEQERAESVLTPCKQFCRKMTPIRSAWAMWTI